MYDDKLYEYDRQGIASSVRFAAGAVLYRATSPTWCQPDQILTGDAAELARDCGRYHRVQQRTTYCANNMLVCISEVLYRMYRGALDRIKEYQPSSHVSRYLKQDRVLVALAVDAVEDLVLVDSADVRQLYGNAYSGTLLVHPDQYYEPLQELADKLRAERKKGVLYPSARHSVGFCVALFDNLTAKVREDLLYELLDLEVRLLPEHHDPAVAPIDINRPYETKLDPTVGYYRFKRPADLARLRQQNLMYPLDLPDQGIVDFVRKRYISYPADAVSE